VSRSDKRPLAQGPDAAERLATLYEQRLPFYRMADVMVETDHLTVDQAASRVASAIAPRLRSAERQEARKAARKEARKDSHEATGQPTGRKAGQPASETAAAQGRKP
jgi:shikimate kinase